MGAGIALEYRLRYPSMYEQYSRLCAEGKIDIGLLWLFKGRDRWILNFPTKKHWKYPTKEQYLRDGLQKFLETYEKKGITSIAFPLLGAQHGGLDSSRSLELMDSYLSRCEIPIEVFRYDPSATDDLYDRFKDSILAMSVRELTSKTKLRADAISRLKEAVQDSDICQLNQLTNITGIGDRTLEKAFAFMRGEPEERERPSQSTLSL